MCGIYGILTPGAAARVDAGALRRMAAASVHRGPDDEGEYVDDDVLLGMRRLSILDVHGGHQPIGTEDGAVQVVCNGEIYNYRGLGAELVRAGHTFKTRSDTEVIAHLYEEHGDALVARLNGMFAFALWDRPRRRLLLGRDRLGIKPLYYRQSGPRLLFASEAKALLALSDARPELDRAALVQYLTLGYVPAPLSMFAGIRKLPPASVMVCQDGRVETSRYWAIPEHVDAEADEESWAGALLQAMDAAVASQMVADVPLGAFLSGGIDSSTIVALMAQHGRAPVKTYSIGFAGTTGAAYYNELPWARKVAERFHTDHHEIIVDPDVVRLLPRLLWHLDEPVADSALLTTYLVAEFARRDVTVILSGVGGDELFCGYRRYLAQHYDRYVDLVPRWLRRGVLLPMVRALPSDRHSPMTNLARHVRAYLDSRDDPLPERYRSYVEVFRAADAASVLRGRPPARFDALGAAFEVVGEGDPLSRMTRVDLLTQLPDDLLLLTDRMTMATSLECRVPFLDNTMIDLALRMPSRVKARGGALKHVVKKALGPLLPPEILHRKKRGFGAPVGAWFKRELAPFVRCLLSRDAVEARGLLQWETIERTIALHDAGREDYTDRLVALTNLELWSRLYLDGRSPEAVSEDLVVETAR